MKTHRTTRIMALAALLALAVSILAACGSGPTKKAELGTEAEVKAAANAPPHTVTSADFEKVTVARDGSSVTLENYKGSAPNIIVPAELEGLPVKWVDFEKNPTIRSVTIADGVGLTEGCFANCANLTSVTLPKGIKEIRKNMFAGCTSLTSFTIPGSVTKIGASAFSGSGIKEMVIPDSVTEIEGELYLELHGVKGRRGDLFFNSAIERVTLPKELEVIPIGMFQGCKNLKSITLPAGLGAIGSMAFYKSGLQSIVIPDSVIQIEKAAFAGTNLTEITIPKNLKRFELSVFANCSSLKRIVIPAGVGYIPECTFENCQALEEITFEGDVIIDENAFGYPKATLSSRKTICENIKKLNAGPGVTKIKGLGNIRMADVSKLPLKEQAELKAAWTAFMQKYGG